MFNLELGFNLLVKLELLLQGAFNLLFKLLRLLCCHAADVFVSYSETSIAAGCFINLYLEHLRAMIIATPRIQII